MAAHPLASVATPFTGSVAPYYNGTLSHASTFSNGSIRSVADFIAQEKIHTERQQAFFTASNRILLAASKFSNGSIRSVADFIAQEKIYTERQQAFFTALNRILPAASPSAKISPLVQFLMTPPEQFGGEEKIKKMLYKPEGYLKRFFGQESWKDWSEDRTDLGYAVSNMVGILETGPGRSVEEFVQTLDAQRLVNANEQAEEFLEPVFATTLSAQCDVEPGSEEDQNFIKQIMYWFGDGAVLPAYQFLGVTLTQVVSREPLDNLDLKSPASRGQLNTECTAILLRWCEQAIINAADPRQTFITSGVYLDKLRDGDITAEDITILRRICRIGMSPTFDSVAFIQQFTDAARGAAGQCGAQAALQMHRTLILAGAGRFHAQSGASVNYLEVETKLTALAYCERIVGQAMQASGNISENRRTADAHIQNLCAGNSVTIGNQEIRVDSIALAKEIVAMLNEIIARDRGQTETILTQMGVAAQDVLLLNQAHPVGSALCLKGAIAPQTAIHPTLRSILNWLARCGIISLPTTPSSANRNYDHLADLFHQLNAFEADDQQAFYTALAVIPLFGSSPLLWAVRNGNRELLETVVRIAGEAAYIPIEGRTLIQWALHENNQELVDCLNRVLADKHWLAAEVYQLLDNRNSADRTRSLRMFSEAAWLHEPRYQDLNHRIGQATGDSHA